MKSLIRPSADWGPALDHHRELYIESLKGTGSRDQALNVTVSLQADKQDIEDNVTAATPIELQASVV